MGVPAYTAPTEQGCETAGLRRTDIGRDSRDWPRSTVAPHPLCRRHRRRRQRVARSQPSCRPETGTPVTSGNDTMNAATASRRHDDRQPAAHGVVAHHAQASRPRPLRDASVNDARRPLDPQGEWRLTPLSSSSGGIPLRACLIPGWSAAAPLSSHATPRQSARCRLMRGADLLVLYPALD